MAAAARPRRGRRASGGRRGRPASGGGGGRREGCTPPPAPVPRTGPETRFGGGKQEPVQAPMPGWGDRGCWGCGGTAGGAQLPRRGVPARWLPRLRGLQVSAPAVPPRRRGRVAPRLRSPGGAARRRWGPEGGGGHRGCRSDRAGAGAAPRSKQR